MNATTHPFAPEEIMAFLDGELSANRAQLVSSHTESCADCRAILDSLRSASQSLSNWSVASLGTNSKLDELLSSRAADAARNRTNTRLWKLVIFSRQHSILLAASSVLAVLALVLVSLNQRQYRMSATQVERALERQTAAKKESIQTTSRGRASTAMTSTLTEEAKDLSYFATGADDAGDKISVDRAELNEQQSPSFVQPMIARTVSLAVVTKDFETSRKSLDAILTHHNGYSAQLSVTTPQGAARSLQTSLRIPAPQLTAAVAELKSLGRVESESQNGEEVTQQHADLVARLKNSRETEQRLQAILAQRTGKISDVLAVEQEIARVRGEIEQMEAEQKNLEHRVDFATIDLTLSEEYKAQLGAPAPSVSTLLHNAVVNGLRTAADSFLSLVLFLSESVPVLLLWLAILALPVWQLWRRYRRAAAAI